MRTILIALGLAAAALPAVAAPPSNAPSGLVVTFMPKGGEENAVRTACESLLSRTSTIGSIQLKRLGDLPPGRLEHAVLRTIGGCPVAEVVWQGQTYYVPSILPSQNMPVDRSPAR